MISPKHITSVSVNNWSLHHTALFTNLCTDFINLNHSNTHQCLQFLFCENWTGVKAPTIHQTPVWFQVFYSISCHLFDNILKIWEDFWLTFDLLISNTASRKSISSNVLTIGSSSIKHSEMAVNTSQLQCVIDNIQPLNVAFDLSPSTAFMSQYCCCLNHLPPRVVASLPTLGQHCMHAGWSQTFLHPVPPKTIILVPTKILKLLIHNHHVF